MTHPLADDAYLRIRDLSKVYGTRDGPVRALDQISFSERRGEFLSTLGPSGCGKSTLLMIAAGLIPPSSGRVEVEGRAVERPRTDVGIVFQSPVLLEWRTALGNVMLQAEARKMDRADAERRARELLTSVGLDGFEHKYPHELSGGMRQRVSICRALIHDPDHLLMDEPFGALDALTREQMNLDLQRIWAQAGKTVFLITHSIAEAVFLGDRVIVMSARPGRVIAEFPVTFARPRSLDVMGAPEFGQLVTGIRRHLAASGALE